MLKLNKTFFSRNKNRKDASDIFSKTSSSINSAMPYLMMLFFAPVLITSTLFSKEIILMIANILLSVGYISNFIYRIYNKEVSTVELLFSPFIFAGFIGLTYVLSPTIAGLTFVSALLFANKIAAAVNLYFLTKHMIIPPIKKLVEKVAKFLKLNIESGYYYRHEFTLEGDRHTVDKLLKKDYRHDSFAQEYVPEKLSRLNKLLSKLCQYINKYEETPFGYFTRREEIADLEKCVNSLTIQGDSDSSYTFIRRKICYKQTKINLFQQTMDAIEKACTEKTTLLSTVTKYFLGTNEKDWETHREERLAEAKEFVGDEIKRQQKKIEALEECLPMPKQM